MIHEKSSINLTMPSAAKPTIAVEEEVEEVEVAVVIGVVQDLLPNLSH